MSAERQRRYRERHPDRVAESSRRYLDTPEGRAKTNARKRAAYAAGKRYPTKQTPEKRAARKAVERAVKRGLMSPGPCSVCGIEPTHAHHHNGYEQALDITWLCRRHHAVAHGQRTRWVA